MKKQICNLYRKTCAKRVHTKVTHFMLAAFSVLVFFTSCSNAFLDGGSASGVKTGTVTGSLDFGGALPKEILDQLNSSSKNSGPQSERTAFPSIPTLNCTLQVYAQIGSNADTRVDASITPGTKKYSIENLTYGKEYTITAKYFSNYEVIMQGSVKVTLSDDEPVVNKNISVAPTQTNGGMGSILLKFSVKEDVGWSSSNVAYSYVLDNNSEQPKTYPGDGKFIFHTSSISSGAHSVKFIFKKINTNYILYQFTETINVFDNLMTDTWVKNGNEPYFTISSYCQITKDCVEKFAQTTFYVDSTRQTTDSSASDYTTQSGTYFNPFVKVSDAVNRINAGSNADYTIYVKDGTKEENITTNLNIKNNVNIETYKNSVGDGLGNATLEYAKIENSSNAVAINASKVSITGIKFLNKSNLNTEKTGISVNSNNSLTMKRCTVEGFTQNSTGFAAGGILIQIGASVDITDCVISKNTGYQGGGIHNKGTLTLKGCTISENTGIQGGGIYNLSGATVLLENVEISDCIATCTSGNDALGGGIYNGGIVTIDDAVISGCKATCSDSALTVRGGGIYNTKTCTIKKAIVTGCYVEGKNFDYCSGAGVCNYMDSAELVLGDGISKPNGEPDVIIGIGEYNGKMYSTPNHAKNGNAAGVHTGISSVNGSTTFVMNSDVVIGKYNPSAIPTESNCGNLCTSGYSCGLDCDKNTKVTINGGYISYNYSKRLGGNVLASAFYINSSCNVSVKNLTVSYNYAQTDDKDIYGAIASYNYKFENLKVFGNSGESVSGKVHSGLYVYENKPVELAGNTWFSSDNEINLDTGAMIKVEDTLTPKDQNGVSKDKVATIRTESYAVGNQVLTGSAVATEYFKFAVKQNPNTSDIYWRVNKSGSLDTKIGTKTKGVDLAVGDIVFNDGSSIPYIEGLTLSDEEKSAAIAVIFRVGGGSDGNKTLGIGINHETTACFASSSKGCSIVFTNTVCKPDDGTNPGSFTFNNSENTDGSQNLKKMIDFGATDTGIIFNADGTVNFESSNQTTLATNYPAFEFAYYYGKNGHNIISESEYETGWYLPSVSELNDIYLENKSTNSIQKALIAAGGIDFNNKNYLTSTQECDSGYTNCVTGFYINTGSKNYIGKNTNDNIRYACAVRAFTW